MSPVYTSACKEFVLFMHLVVQQVLSLILVMEFHIQFQFTRALRFRTPFREYSLLVVTSLSTCGKS